MRLIFKDGTTLECTSYNDGYIVFPFGNINTIWGVLTEKPIAGAKIVEDESDDVVVVEFTNEHIFEGTLVVEPDRIYGNIRRKTDTEILMEKVAMLEESKEVTDGAISDLGAAISEIAEGGR